MSQSNRFLLIRAWGCGFWSAMEHVSGMLLIAELTGRIPVVFWGAESLYASESPMVKDAYTMYYEPVSKYTVSDLERGDYSFFPFRWNQHNIRLPEPFFLADLDNVPELFQRPENVIVSNIHTAIHYFEHMIDKNHPVFGFEFEDIHRYLYQKYFKLQPSLTEEIEDFYVNHMKHRHPVVGVHIRGSDKIIERPHLPELNSAYPQEINQYIENNPNASIFLLTDSEPILEQYKALYGERLIYTDCIRTPDEKYPVHYGLPYYNTRQKGIDIIKDTYLAMKCDHFIGAGYSNVSIAIHRLKDWKEGAITILPE